MSGPAARLADSQARIARGPAIVSALIVELAWN